MSPSTAPRKSLKVAVMLERVQLSDIVGIDMIGNLSTEYFKVAVTLNPQFAAFEDDAIDLTIYYLAVSLDPSDVTPGLKYLPNMTYDDCPRDLDIVLMGGNAFSDRPPQADKFIKEAWGRTPIFMTTCIGSLWLASSGVLKGMKATTNRAALGGAGKMHPDVEWLDQRWVVEPKPAPAGTKGQLWTSGGAGCGIEMIARYLLENFDTKFISGVSLGPLDFHPTGSRGQFYKGSLEDEVANE